MTSQAALSVEQLDHYRREGYVVAERFLSPSALKLLDRTIRQISDKAIASGDWAGVLEVEPEPAGGGLVARRIYSPFDQHEDFRAVATDPRLLDCIEALIGPNITLQHSKLNMKPAQVGSAVEWHQDMAYFPHTNDDLVTTLIYLDDATVENGCLQVLPRHHTHFFDHALADGSFAGMITEDLDSGRFGKSVPLAAPAGSVIFMHCITPHSSLPNRSQHGRRTLIYEYRAADSFPIYFSEMTMVAEAKFRLVRGRPATHARLAGPAPLIPRVGKFASLYELQQKAKESLVGNRAGQRAELELRRVCSWPWRTGHMGQIDCAVIGAGWWGTTAHVPALLRHPHARLLAVQHHDAAQAERTARDFGVPHGWASVRRVLDLPGLAAVVISSTPNLHFRQAKAALDRGLHVLLEKPMCISAAHARQLVEMAAQKRLHLALSALGISIRTSSKLAAWSTAATWDN